MFYGTTPQVVSQYLYKVFADKNPKRIFVPFAGNFVVEQIARKACTDAEIFSTDISLYSRAIGFGVMDREMKLDVKPEYSKLFPYVAKLKTPLEKAAGVIFFTEVAPNLKKENIPYYRSLNRNAVHMQGKYINDILFKLNKAKEELENIKFDGRDAKYLIKEAGEGDIVFYDPPVLLGDYENMFEPMEEMFLYDPEPYEEMTEELKLEQLAKMDRKKCIVYWRTNNPITPPNKYNQIYQYQYKYHGNYCIYSNDYADKWVGRFEALKEEPKNIPIISLNDEITIKSKVEVVPVSGKLANHYRLMWVKKAEMTDMGSPFLILIDGKLVGMFVLDSGLKFGTDLALIVSDPSAPTSKYKRLSKLVLYIISTEQMLKQFNDITMWEHEGFTTRVFTNAPTSMKYRSLFKLKERTEEVEGNFKYKLIYQNREKIMPTLKAGLTTWLQKDGKHIYES